MNAQINIRSKVSSKVTTETYELDVDGMKIIYIEYFNEKGKVIDTVLRNEEGIDLEDAHLLGSNFNSVAELLDEIQVFVDKH